MSVRNLLLLCASLLLVACGRRDSPEIQVRKVVDAIEVAAEARDVGDVMAFVSNDFRDAYGQGPDELRRRLYGYFLANQSIHLLTRLDGIEFPVPDEARLRIKVGMVGREADAADAWSLAADIREFDVTLRKEGDGWKVVYAQIRPAG